MASAHIQSKNNPVKSATFSRWQSIVILCSVVIFFVLGLTLGSLTSIGSALRSAIYQSRSQIDLTGVQEIYGILHRDFDGTLNDSVLQNGAKSGLVAATGDEFTRYLSPEAARALTERMNGNGFVGIGVELGFKEEKLVIISPQDGSPAQAAGLQAGDVIYAINNTPVAQMAEEEAVQALRGDAGTTVTLTILRDDQQKVVTITRRAITTSSVRATITDQNIGILTITTFDATTVHLARQAAQNFKNASVRGVVLDLRDNGGGAVTAAQGVLGLWLPKGSLVMTEKRGTVTLRTYKTESEPLLGTTHTVVLLNKGSASASEVVAGALRDYNKATLLGTQSFGKGSVQEVRPLNNGGALIFTVSRWFTPKGKNIDGKGITPDVIVEQSTDTDAQLSNALQKLLTQ